MNHSTNAIIFVKSADKVIIQNVGNSTITSTLSSSISDSNSTIDGAIFAKDDLTINGSGTLNITSNLNGIVAKDDLKILGSLTLNVNAKNKGIDANDSVRIGGGNINISSSHDAIHVENDDSDGFFYMEDGSLNLKSDYDCLDVGGDTSSYSGYIKIAGGDISCLAPYSSIKVGSNASKSSSVSQKGLKCDGDIYIGDANIEISTADDSLHSGASISITNGTLNLSSSDDGIHADSTLAISNGTVNVNKSYEGLEAYIIDISGGDISIVSSDDGINAAGGSDSLSNESHPWSNSSSSGTLKISGGNIYVNASGDGLDSNGSIYVSGGYTIIEGPTTGGNGALDKGDSSSCVASITGGVVLAIGTSDMAINFDTGNQCSGLVSLSNITSGTIISVDDGSNFSYKVTKSWSSSCSAVYSSPNMKKGNSYNLTYASSSVTMSFTSSYYYSNVSNIGGGMHGGGGHGR